MPNPKLEFLLAHYIQYTLYSCTLGTLEHVCTVQTAVLSPSPGPGPIAKQASIRELYNGTLTDPQTWRAGGRSILSRERNVRPQPGYSNQRGQRVLSYSLI